jgi:hypothetical protein
LAVGSLKTLSFSPDPPQLARTTLATAMNEHADP